MRENDNRIIEQLYNGMQTAFINGDYNSNLAYRPEFISNNYKQGKKVLSSIEQELRNCDEFFISVAFITLSGITPLLQTLKELEEKNIRGKILTTNYLMFSDPVAIDKLANLSNIEIKMFCVGSDSKGFHTKGYIFQKEEVYRIIIGSSNITQNAMTKNFEWNTKIVANENGEIVKDILGEFNTLWSDSHSKYYNDFIEDYRTKYAIIKAQQKVAKKEEVVDINRYKLQPNSMQISFVNNILKMRSENIDRALLLSATGTGKTIASAFALRELNPNKALFLVHREQIDIQSINGYKKVFGNEKKFGLLSGHSNDMDADYLFSTMQMMAKPEIYSMFSKDEFEIIIIDEVHHAGAPSYQRIMNYFTPHFWLGMTGSPDTSNYDIYSLFNHHIAYEIRLQQALEEDLLCPFHYFGITDLEIEGEVFDDNTGVKNFGKLISYERVRNIIKKAEYYGFSGDRVKGLIFCSRKEEARELSNKFNHLGYRTDVLTGDDSQERRQLIIKKLVSDKDCDNQLDYIFTVDIFNEGVDIPEINQVIMLRPTESPVIFIQQLGRGLRKHEDKEFVVILDFIGNYMNNFMIPVALSGDRTYSKDSIRKYIMEGSRIIPGCSTIHFDEISKKRIFDSVDKISTTKKLLTEKYFVLKNKLGKIPQLMDFYNYGEIDPLLFIEYSGSYHGFLQNIERDYKVDFGNKEVKTIEFTSANLVNGKRPHELLMLKFLLGYGEFNKGDVKKALIHEYQHQVSEDSIESAINVLAGRFMNTQSEKRKYNNLEILAENGKKYTRMMAMYHQNIHPEFFNHMKDLIELGLRRYKDIYQPAEDDLGLALYQKYSRKDVCRLLNWERDDSSTIYGYKIKNGTCPIFVTYKKKEDIAESTKYLDAFENNMVFSWMTRSRVSENSVESQEIIHHKERNLKILLFIKKSDGEGSDFYYMGQVDPIRWNQTVINNDSGKVLPIMNFKLKLKQGVREDIYDYLVN